MLQGAQFRPPLLMARAASALYAGSNREALLYEGCAFKFTCQRPMLPPGVICRSPTALGLPPDSAIATAAAVGTALTGNPATAAMPCSCAILNATAFDRLACVVAVVY